MDAILKLLFASSALAALLWYATAFRLCRCLWTNHPMVCETNGFPPPHLSNWIGLSRAHHRFFKFVEENAAQLADHHKTASVHAWYRRTQWIQWGCLIGLAGAVLLRG